METTSTKLNDLVAQIRHEEREAARSELRAALVRVLDGDGPGLLSTLKADKKQKLSNGHAKTNGANGHVEKPKKKKPRTAAQIAASSRNIAKARRVRMAKIKDTKREERLAAKKKKGRAKA